MLVDAWSKVNITWAYMGKNWGHCRSAFIWSRAKLQWKYWNITWADITCFVEAATVIKKGGGLDEFYEWQRQQEEEKRKRMVRVVCQVRGTKYTEEHYRNNSMISVDDVRLVVKELGVDIFIDDVEVHV